MKFLSEQYYEERAKEFYELKLGSMLMKELSSKFLSLLKYVPYIIDEKTKIQRFLSCFPTSFKDRIEFDNPKTLEEAMRKADFCYEHSKKREPIPKSKHKRTSNFDHKRKGFNSNKSFGNNSPRIIIKEKILRIKHSKIIHHQKAGICLTIMLK